MLLNGKWQLMLSSSIHPTQEEDPDQWCCTVSPVQCCLVAPPGHELLGPRALNVISNQHDWLFAALGKMAAHATQMSPFGLTENASAACTGNTEPSNRQRTNGWLGAGKQTITMSRAGQHSCPYPSYPFLPFPQLDLTLSSTPLSLAQLNTARSGSPCKAPSCSSATMSAVTRGLRTASKQLRVSRSSWLSVGRSASVGAAARVFATPSSTLRSNFSTSVTRHSGAPVMASQPREYDPEIKDIADYVANKAIDSDLAFDTARWILLDTLGCGLEGLRFKECTKLLGPIVPGTVVPNGTKVPGTPFVLDPVNGAFNIGAMIRWLDFNDCWLAAEWGHPSDNLGAILAVADWINRTNKAGGNLAGGKIYTVKDVLEAMIKAHEIQGCLALLNSFNKVGLDHVVLVKVASAAVVSKMLGLNEKQIADAVTQAWVDGQSLRTYRHSPNTMSRKSWAAGDACQRAVNLALKVMKGEQGVPTVLSAPTWGFYDVLFKGNKFQFQRPYGSYVMENVLFKVSYPAEFHSQTAVEASEKIFHQLKAMGKSAADIKAVTCRTHEACIRIIDKQFKPMDNFADRDHCIQYMCSVMLVFGRLEATDYTDGGEAATSELVESLRKKIKCVEDTQYTQDYHDPALRTISNALTVELNDGTVLDEVAVEAPLGHRLRREEAKPVILAKFKRHLEPHLSESRVKELVELSQNSSKLDNMSVDEYVDLYTVKESKFL